MNLNNEKNAAIQTNLMLKGRGGAKCIRDLEELNQHYYACNIVIFR